MVQVVDGRVVSPHDIVPILRKLSGGSVLGESNSIFVTDQKRQVYLWYDGGDGESVMEELICPSEVVSSLLPPSSRSALH